MPGRNLPILALDMGEWEIARYLIRAGANPFQADLFGDTALHACVSDVADEERIEMLRTFVELGGSLESIDRRGQRP